MQVWCTDIFSLLDATTYADFSTFASNQTGNAILLTVAAVGTRKVLVLLTGVSLGGFLGFAFIFGHIGHWFGESTVPLRSQMLISQASAGGCGSSSRSSSRPSSWSSPLFSSHRMAHRP